MNLNDYAKKIALPLTFLQEIGLSSNKDILTIPYFTSDGKAFRSRYRQGDKRWWGEGNGIIPYGVWRLKDDPGLYLIICEGESDTQTLWYHGFRTLGVPGATTFKSTWADYLKGYEAVYIAGDTDPAGKKFNQDVAAKLLEGGYRGEIMILEFPGDCKDINELHCQDSERFKDRFNRIIGRGRLVDSSSLPYICSYDDGKIKIQKLPFIQLREVEPKETEFVIDGFLPADFLTNIFGDGGQGKSYLALTIASCVAAGKDFLGKTTVKGKVAFVDFELTEREQALRAHRIAKGLSFNSPPEGLLYLCPGIQENVPTNLMELIKALKEEIKNQDIKLTIIDSLGAAIQGDPSEAKDVCKLFQQLRGLGTVLLIDHQSKMIKGEKYLDKTPFGSVYKTNLARNVYQLKAITNQPGEIKGLLYHRKSNFTSLNDPIGLTLTFGDDSFMVDQCDLGPEFTEHLGVKEQVLAILQDLREATAEEIAEKVESTLGAVRNALTGLQATKKVEQAGKKDKATIYRLAKDSSPMNHNDDEVTNKKDSSSQVHTQGNDEVTNRPAGG